MPRKAYNVQQKENKDKLVELIKLGIEKSGQPLKEVARRAGIHQSHLSQVLNQGKSLSKAKLVALAKGLAIPRNEILQAAGYEIDDSYQVTPSIPALNFGGSSLDVVTDPRFVDSALFMWMFSKQPFHGIKCNLIPVYWDEAPQRVSELPHAIGFYNRRVRAKVGEHPLYDVVYWTDLCLYKGYAFIARTGGSKNVKNRNADEYLRDLIEQCSHEQLDEQNGDLRPLIISMGADTDWILPDEENPVIPSFTKKNFKAKAFRNPDDALNQFMNGLGNLFIGGLPQRFAATENVKCEEVLNYDNNPMLVSINSLICSRPMYETERLMLSVASHVWFETIAKIRSDARVREKVISEILSLLKDLRVYNHHLTAELLAKVLPGGTNSDKYEVFPDRPADLLNWWHQMIVKVFEKTAFENKKDEKKVTGILSIMDETLKEEIGEE